MQAGLFLLTTMKTVAIHIGRIEHRHGVWKWSCHCEWCKWRPEPVDTLAEIIRLARSHVKKCKFPVATWKPVIGRPHEGWLIGLK